MNFTAKEDYGLRAALDVAAHGSGLNGRGTAAPVQTREIALRQRIPEQFLEQLLASLRRAEIVRSTRGAGGGYTLAAPPGQISVAQVLRALSGPLVPTELVTDAEGGGNPNHPENAVVRGVWGDLRRAIEGVAEKTSLQDLLDRRSDAMNEQCYMMHI